MRYVDRVDAGRSLASGIAAQLANHDLGACSPVVLGIPRGGVVVAREVAEQLSCDLDIALARKIGAPGNPELAIGAVGETGDPFLAECIDSDLRCQRYIPGTGNPTRKKRVGTAGFPLPC